MIFRKTSAISYRYLVACIVLTGLITLSCEEAKAAAQQAAKGISKEEKPSEELRELPKNNLRILLALLPVFYVVTTSK